MSKYWDTYDVNGDNRLEKSEFRVFITDMYMDVLREQNGGIEVDKSMLEAKINSEFESIFTDFDTDKNGYISRDEMYYFVLELLGVEVQNLDFKKMNTERESKVQAKKQISEEDMTPELKELLQQLKTKDEELKEIESDKTIAALEEEVEQKQK